MAGCTKLLRLDHSASKCLQLRMRQAFMLLLGVLVQLGLCGRLTAGGGCCPSLEPVGAHCHAGDHDHGHSVACQDHACAGDRGGHDAGHREECPPDCGEHHHRCVCIHAFQMSCLDQDDFHLVPPCAVALSRDRQQVRVPEDPVMEMDKPPLI